MSHSVIEPMTLVQWATHSTNAMCHAKQLKSLVEFQEFQALQTQANHTHSADQAAMYYFRGGCSHKQTHRGVLQRDNSVP